MAWSAFLPFLLCQIWGPEVNLPGRRLVTRLTDTPASLSLSLSLFLSLSLPSAVGVAPAGGGGGSRRQSASLVRAAVRRLRRRPAVLAQRTAVPLPLPGQRPLQGAAVQQGGEVARRSHRGLLLGAAAGRPRPDGHLLPGGRLGLPR